MAADAELIFRSSANGALTVDETTAAFDVGPTPLDGLPVRLTIPAEVAATTLAVLFKTCATIGGTYLEEARFSLDETTDGVTTTLTSAGVYRKRIGFKRRYLKVTFDVTGAAAFGAVDCRAETAGEYDNARRDL